MISSSDGKKRNTMISIFLSIDIVQALIDLIDIIKSVNWHGNIGIHPEDCANFSANANPQGGSNGRSKVLFTQIKEIRDH